MSAPRPSPADDGLIAALVQALGPEAVRDDEGLRVLMSQDVWTRGDGVAEVVVAPADLDALARAVETSARHGRVLAIRGGGMSYTKGYAPSAAPTVLLDLSAMDRVLEVDAEAMTVTVQAGCTWKTLRETLAPLGLRTPFWGPLSGISSTIGGGLSQLNAVFGSGHWGTTSESVVGLAVVLADGSVLRTGARRPEGEAFYRHYGPDLTGLFCGDAGAFGVKAEITLRLMRAPAHEGFASFAFADREGLVRASAEISRAGVACETVAFDPALARVRLKRASIMAGLGAVGAVARSGKSLLEGVKAAAGVALAGRGFLPEESWSLHVVAEGRSAAGVEADVAEARRIAREAGGQEVEASIPRVLRAQPFTPLNNILGPDGERWVPVHGIVSHRDAQACFAAIEELFTELAPRFEAEGVTTGMMVTTLSTNGFLIEPVFFWPEARRELHDATVDPKLLARMPRREENPAATALVAEARARVIETFERFGAAHFQIGRTYPWLRSRDDASRALAGALKFALDPDRRLNPGALDL